MRASRALLVLLLIAAQPAVAMNFVTLEYDEAADELTFVIAYRGTHENHDFTIAWEACRPLGEDRFQIFGKVIDSDPRDPAREEFKKEVKLSLKGFECRPSRLSLGTFYNHIRTIDIPASKPQPRR